MNQGWPDEFTEALLYLRQLPSAEEIARLMKDSFVKGLKNSRKHNCIAEWLRSHDEDRQFQMSASEIMVFLADGERVTAPLTPPMLQFLKSFNDNAWPSLIRDEEDSDVWPVPPIEEEVPSVSPDGVYTAHVFHRGVRLAVITELQSLPKVGYVFKTGELGEQRDFRVIRVTRTPNESVFAVLVVPDEECA